MMEQIRSFIAIELPAEVKLALASLQERLKSGSRAPVRWVEPDNIHLTLKFLGNIDAGITGQITAALREAVGNTRPFHLEVKGLGVFPNPRRVQIVWVGLTGELDSLTRLHRNIESGLVPLGFKAETRPFSPHLTLARVRDRASPRERQGLGNLVTGISFESGTVLNVDSVHLMRSQLTDEGPVYTRISSVNLS